MYLRKLLQRFLNLVMMNKKSGIYIHIPFCLKKCSYCGFLSKEIRKDDDRGEIDFYIDNLLREIKIRKNDTNGSIFDTIYFGGGTPSLLKTKQIEKVLDILYSNYKFDEDIEITLEANPETLNKSKLKEIKSTGINRLSMGIQSFDNKVLKRIGRIHTAEKAISEYNNARKAGFENISFDLMFSLPNTRVNDARVDLIKAINLDPEHISFYSLQLEEGTKFFEEFEKGELSEIPDEIDRKIYHSGIDILKSHGYEQYEISNFSKVNSDRKINYRSRHNSKYWDMSPFIGFGLGASSYFYSKEEKNEEFSGNLRVENYSDMKNYSEAIKGGIRPFLVKNVNTYKDDLSEAIFTGLRRIDGIRYDEIGLLSREEFEDIFKESKDELSEFISLGYIKMNDEGLKLTEGGIDISNKIMSIFV